MTFVSYAQNCEDVMLWRALKTVGTGFYIDVGAAHPDRDSVTRALYDRGWRGINIEPVPANARRLAAARTRDVTLPIALGAAPGRANFFVVAVGDNTDLSTLDDAIGRSYAGRGDVREIEVEVRTLAEVCRNHVDGPIHVLKIDVERAEQAVLEGADFARFRPWIVLVEATAPIVYGAAEHATLETHESWEPILLDADYRFVWFDGLNRFYVAAEKAGELAPHFRYPPNVVDDFLRAVDGEAAQRIEQAERRIAVAEALQRESTQRMQAADERGQRMALRMAREAASLAELERMFRERTAERHQLAQHVHFVTEQALDLINQVNILRNELGSVRTSTSWRITRPMRKALRVLQRLRGRPRPLISQPNFAPVAAPLMPESVANEPLPSTRTYLHPLCEVHQYHHGSATGDAITSSMLLTRRLLRAAGYHSHIYVSNRDPALARELRSIDELPERNDYVLIVRHSMGHESMARILALPCAKVLMYHNITPPEFLDHPSLREAARLGRVQLTQMRQHVAAALADSEYNAIELRSIGFNPVRACTLLFDPADLIRPRDEAPDPARPFTVLFVGRIVESKGQLELIEAFAAFVRAFGQRARLVLVGRHGGEEDSYLQALRGAIRTHGLTGSVIITGAVSDAERDVWYGEAHLYVSLSQHEGFGVPLVEAMANGVPVMAWPAGAVADTLGAAGELLGDPSPSAVAGCMVALARDTARRTALAEAGRRALERFAPARHMPRLIEALIRAGAAPPPDPDAHATLVAGMRFAIAGHVNGSYSLAAINRTLATLIEQVRPGRVRVLPLEGIPIEDLSRVPDAERPAIAQLAGRPAPVTGPEVVITQHYPVCLPTSRSDLALALVFWEESLLLADTVSKLNCFDGILAPSRFMKELLAESGVSRPIRLFSYAQRLDHFLALGAPRARRGGPTVFLHVSSCLPRNGIDLLLRSYTAAFRRDDAVELVIKGHPNPYNDAPAQIERLRATDPDAPPIRYIGDDLSEDALLELYCQADAMVLPTRGEGYNVPAAEALAAGLPLIATRFGGHLDFCGPNEARLVDWTYAASRSHLATPDSVWVEPDLEELVGALREVVDEPAAARVRAARGRCRIQKAVDGGALVARLAHIAADLLTTPPAAPVHVAWISSWSVHCGVAEYSRHLLPHLMSHPGLEQVTVMADHRPPDPTIMADALELDVQRSWGIGDPSAAKSLLAALLRADPGITVIQHHPGLMPWPVLATLLRELHRSRPMPTVVTLHTTRHLLAIEEDERADVVEALRRAARVLVLTIDDLNRLKQLGIEGHVALLPHGTHPPRSPRPARVIAASEPVLIGGYGFLLPEKGIPQLIAAAGLLRRRWPELRLRLVTALYPHPQDEHELQACRDVIATAGLGDAVELITEFLPHENSVELLAACDLLVMPNQSSMEASSAALRTALSSGVPVAVTPVPLFDESESVVQRLPGMTPAKLAEGIDALLADASARVALAQAAHTWCASLTWDGIGNRLAGLLRQLTCPPC